MQTGLEKQESVPAESLGYDSVDSMLITTVIAFLRQNVTRIHVLSPDINRWISGFFTSVSRQTTVPESNWTNAVLRSDAYVILSVPEWRPPTLPTVLYAVAGDQNTDFTPIPRFYCKIKFLTQRRGNLAKVCERWNGYEGEILPDNDI